MPIVLGAVQGDSVAFVSCLFFVYCSIKKIRWPQDLSYTCHPWHWSLRAMEDWSLQKLLTRHTGKNECLLSG